MTCRGLEKALDRYAQPGSAAAASDADAAADGDQKAKRSSARESRKQAMKNLSVPERDVLLVLGAICKVCCACCACCLRVPAAPFHLQSMFLAHDPWKVTKVLTATMCFGSSV